MAAPDRSATAASASRSRARPWPQVSIARSVRDAAVPSIRELRRWAAAALGRAAAGREISVLIVGSARSRALNRRYRGRDKPTNVLSFPAMTGAAGATLGDLVICPPILRREARSQGKSQRAHWMHLYVHGLLHLAGFDHERPADARRMEQREIRVLRGLGVANPYRSH
jgi:probable rRNA maturation factor